MVSRSYFSPLCLPPVTEELRIWFAKIKKHIDVTEGCVRREPSESHTSQIWTAKSLLVIVQVARIKSYSFGIYLKAIVIGSLNCTICEPLNSSLPFDSAKQRRVLWPRFVPVPGCPVTALLVLAAPAIFRACSILTE